MAAPLETLAVWAIKEQNDEHTGERGDGVVVGMREGALCGAGG